MCRSNQYVVNSFDVTLSRIYKAIQTPLKRGHLDVNEIHTQPPTDDTTNLSREMKRDVNEE